MTPKDSESTTATASMLGLLDAPEIALGRIVKPAIIECSPSLPLYEAAQRMNEAQVSSILVVDGEVAIGIWTERDALAVDFRDPAAFARPVEQVMSSPVRTVSAELTVQELAVRFRDEHVRHFLVVDEDGRRRGIVSQTDVVLNQGIEHYLRLRKVSAVVKGVPYILDESTSLAQATAVMRESAIDAVVVHYAEGDFGILTERDVAVLVARQSGDAPIGRLASRPLLAVEEHTSLYRVRTLLADKGVRHVGVLRGDGTLAGLVSFADILSGMELAYVQELQDALRQRDEALNVSQRNLHLAEKVIETSLEGILITDEAVRIVSVNPAFTRLTGYRPEEVIGRNPSVLGSGRHDPGFYAEMWRRLLDDGHWQGEIWNRRKDGEIFPELLTITAIRDRSGRVTNYAALFSDISELKENEDRIKHLAYYDPLTRLPNRRLLEDRLQVALAHAHRNRTLVAVLFMDLDRFKRINDSLGHQVGDHLLVEVAHRLKRCVREDDTVARLGGDEFVIVLSDITDPDDAAQTAWRLIEALQQPVLVDSHELTVTTSIGIGIYPDDGEAAAELVKHADVAMYRAKEAGRNSFQLYQAAMNARSLEHLALETALHRALDRGELELFYQPIQDAGRCEVPAVEALLRWRHPEHGLLMPGDFLPLAEESGFILTIGEWVLDCACRQLRVWHEAGHRALRLQVNVSARQFGDAGFVPMVERVVQAHRVSPQHMVLELTEKVLAGQGERAHAVLTALDTLGFALALDAFGTGSTSLAQLRDLPLAQLKIDRSLVAGIGHSERETELVAAVVGLARSLRLQPVAVGVETERQLAFLRDHGCGLVQGFRCGAPLPAGELAFLTGG